METFTITCAIKNEDFDLKVRFKQSSITYFYIYKANTWICTLQKLGGKKYRLLSYSRFPISNTDVDAIGKQICKNENLREVSSSLAKPLKAA